MLVPRGALHVGTMHVGTQYLERTAVWEFPHYDNSYSVHVVKVHGQHVFFLKKSSMFHRNSYIFYLKNIYRARTC